MNKDVRLIAGAMSGTSADGVDVAVVRIEGRGVGMECRLLKHHYLAYGAKIREAIFDLRRTGTVGLRELGKLGREISLVYAAAVNEALKEMGLTGADLDAVAGHGQTLFHEPPVTIQWFDPAVVAEGVGCAVVSDFRRADCAVGGQGAPLVPFADYVLFRHPAKNRVMLNIGGIANITWLAAGAGIEDVLAMDTGPGNCLSDWLMRKSEPNGCGYDAGGAKAMRGCADEQWVKSVCGEEYFRQIGPKTTDIPAMVGAFEKWYRQIDLDDALATACKITAVTIAAEIRKCRGKVDEVIASGGGVENAAIMRELQRELGGNVVVKKSDEMGVPSSAKEAMAFALLGTATLDGVPGNVPGATGAARAVVLGAITPKP